MTDQPLLPFTAFDHQALQQSQAANLRWCEAWGKTLPEVAGVPIGQALTFDLIGLLNRSVIEHLLGPTPDFVAIAESAKQRVEAEIAGLPQEVVSAHSLGEGIPELAPPGNGKQGKRQRLRKPKVTV